MAKLAIILLVVGAHWSEYNEKGVPRFKTVSEPPNNYFHPEFERNKDDSAIGVCEWDLYASHEYEKYKIRRNVEYFLLPATRDVSVFRPFMQELSEIAIASDSVTLLNQLREFRYTKRSALSPRTLTEEEKV